MKKYLRQIELWFIERYHSGEAWDLFLLGLVGMVTLIVGLLIFS